MVLSSDSCSLCAIEAAKVALEVARESQNDRLRTDMGREARMGEWRRC